MSSSEHPAVSLILPLPWWQAGLSEFCKELRETLTALAGSYELLLVLDTTDAHVRKQLNNLKEQFPEIHVLFTARRMGDSAALLIGARAAKARRVIILDPLLHIAVKDLPRLLKPMDTGMDMVCAWRYPKQTRGTGWAASALFNWLVRIVSRVSMHDLACRTYAVKRQALLDIPMYGDLHRFLPIFLARNGVSWCEVKLPARRAQPMVKSPAAYSRRFFDLLTLAFLTRFSRRPLHFFGLLGLAGFGAGFVICARLAYEKLFLHVALSQRPVLLLGVLLIVIGVQIASIGLLGELIIFTQAKHAEDYSIQETLE